jgi:hypothetical protein
MPYGLLADCLVALHATFVAFVVCGELAILVGICCRWDWVRSFWFRTAHLLAIGYVAFEAAVGYGCPLTIWENQFRELSGQPVSEASFVGRLFHNLIFVNVPEAYLSYVHIGFGLLVLATFCLAPPRLPSFGRRSAQSAVS